MSMTTDQWQWLAITAIGLYSAVLAHSTATYASENRKMWQKWLRGRHSKKPGGPTDA